MFNTKHGPRKHNQRRMERECRSRNTKSTAFEWSAYKSRCTSLSLLRRIKTRANAQLQTTDGYSERLHWQVLVSLCPNLIKKSSVSHNIDPSTGLSCRVIRLPSGIGQEMARLLVDCAYGERQSSLNESNLDEFFEICSDYQINYGIKVCLNWAKTILDPLNCVYMFKLASMHHHLKLKCAAYSMMRSNFKQILQINPDFHRLEHHHLVGLLRDNALRLNDDEELAWLAVLRWLRRKPMTQARLTNLYNQMAAGPQDVLINLFQNNPMQRVALDQPPSNGRQSTNEQQQQQQQQQQQPIRILINFYSPGYSCHKQQVRKLSSQVSPSTPLKQFATHEQEEICETKLLTLVKCLRYMRFKSVTAFDVIASHQLVSCSDKLTSLVNTMRIRYKLRHKIALTNEDKQSMCAEYLARLKLEESSRASGVVARISRFLKPNSNEQRKDITRMSVRLVAESSRAESQEETQESGDLMERCAEPRVPSSVGFLFGGWQDGAISKTIWSYDFVYDHWFKLNIRLPEARALHASCVSPANGHIYIFGGTDGEKILNSVWRFNPYGDVRQASSEFRTHQLLPKNQVARKSNLLRRTIDSRTPTDLGTKSTLKRVGYRFKKLCPMNEPRCHVAGVFHSDGRLYALGGHNGNQRLRSSEWYDSKSNQWHRIADMTIARSDAAACSHEGKIYIAGGHISDQLIQSSVEFYRSSDNTWTFAAPMIIPRMSFCLVSYKSQLLALGGTNGLVVGDEVASVTRSVERYNRDSGSWSFCAPMVQKRCSFAAMLIENKLIVLGGHGGYRRLNKCELLRIGQFSATQVSNIGAQISGVVDRTRRFSELPNQLTPEASEQQNQPSTSGNNRSNSIATTGIDVEPHQLSAGVNQLSFRLLDRNTQRVDQVTFRSALKWVRRADLPERRSGFSIAVVPELRNARDYTYFGSLVASQRGATKTTRPVASKKSCPLIRQPSRWKKFKIIKRRKLMKHLKIALVVSIVILIM